MLNCSDDSDSCYQVDFHVSHRRPVFGERQIKNHFGYGCLPVSHVITAHVYGENKGGEKIVPK